MLEATEVKLSENAKGPRVWLQGGRAKQAGFAPGVQYRCVINPVEHRVSLFSVAIALSNIFRPIWGH
jgi:hypothetical protein